MDNLEEAMWCGTPRRLGLARAKARELKRVGRWPHLAAHSLMLSTYYSIGGTANRMGRLWYGLLATWHALVMVVFLQGLNHNQLDVLLSFLLRAFRALGLPVDLLIGLANREIDLALRSRAKSSQLALAYLQWARCELDPTRALRSVEEALALEAEIRREGKDVLPQLVRILRGAGEITFSLGQREGGYSLAVAAFNLAKEVGAKDQVDKTLSILQRMKRELGL